MWFGLLTLTGISIFGLTRINSALQPLDVHSQRTATRLERLWKMALVSMRDHKYIPAEKALLTILRIDHKNAPAYNRLGILYAKQQNFDDSIECFEIASSIDRKPSSLHNLGLIYYETKQYDKAAAAFEKALSQEPLAVRYIALAKAQQQLGQPDAMIDSLEKAVELEPNPQTYQLLIEGYKHVGRHQKAQALTQKLKTLIIRHHENRIRQPRRVA